MIKSDARNFEHQFQDRDNPKQIRKKIIMKSISQLI